MALDARQKETVMFAVLTRAAALGEACPTCEYFAGLFGEEEGGVVSTTVLVMQRLERQGLIHVERFQRSRVVTILATGQRTAEPKNKTPHWRHIRAQLTESMA